VVQLGSYGFVCFPMAQLTKKEISKDGGGNATEFGQLATTTTTLKISGDFLFEREGCKEVEFRPRNSTNLTS
jgi:hypothetical protein